MALCLRPERSPEKRSFSELERQPLVVDVSAVSLETLDPKEGARSIAVVVIEEVDCGTAKLSASLTVGHRKMEELT